MNTKSRTVLTHGSFATLGILVGAALVWTLTGAGEHGEGVGRAVLDTPKDSFTLSGSLSQAIRPGIFAPLDLTISNSSHAPIVVTELKVTVSAVDAPNASALLPCSAADFDVRQVDKQFTLVVNTKSTRALSQLGLPSTAWPQIGMPLDESRNQDGCKGASLTLSYTAVGRVRS